jgi:hypothetical protein
MIKKILLMFVTITLVSCSAITEKMPKRKACTGDETNKTLAEAMCKKQ